MSKNTLPSVYEPPSVIEHEPKAPSDFRRPAMIGLAVIGIAFGGFGSWAAVAPLDSAVVAQGQLVVESKRKTVQHLEGGIVSQLLVKDGDRVKQGDVLIRLDGARQSSILSSVEVQLADMRALEARLVSERDEKGQVEFPPELLEQAKHNPKIAEILESQRSQFEERRRSLSGQMAILEQRISQLQADVQARTQQRDSKNRQAELLESELEGLRELARKGFYPRNRLLAQERLLAEIQGDAAIEQGAISRAERSIGETRLEIFQTRQRFRETVVSELREAQAKANTLAEEFIAALDVSTRLQVTAPVSGVVQDMQIFTEGGVIPAGAKLMDIVPDDDRLVIEAKLSPQDIEAVVEGRYAEIRFNTLNARTTPVIEGMVTTVSADRITDPRNPDRSYYLARVEVSKEEEAKLADHRLTPGMPVDVLVKTGSRTALSYMIKPLQDGFALSLKER
ncbi:HlyD family type I secretion periplasmic adaptor subunit [Telmatospirillum sp. J64-1]|uniref:HlyD family type I secretion periplasmic adaptor subunit n=1 Tax=Telmatospirillum sp. J64-1 TaxID=2502183 RepID=UPI00115E0E51|nr:HlyD family type I secretion periplasmic adaptor subunit [Telmatospirillum sp. J64-1]